jgi:glycosyltransferase involved in cell wall biosynthesis
MTSKRRVAVFQRDWMMQSQTVNLVTSLLADGFGVDVFLHRVGQRYTALPVGDHMTDLRVIDFSPELAFAAVTAPRTSSIKGRVRKQLRPDSFLHRLYYLAGGVRQQPGAAKEALRYATRRSDLEFLLPSQLQEHTWQKMQGRTYCALIGVERAGIVWAGAVADRIGTPLIYFSLELYTQDFPHDPMGSGVGIRCLNRMEAHYHRLSQATIIQDAARAEVLLKDNDVVQTQLLFLPVSLLGPPQREKSVLFHRMLNLPSGQHILLVFGKIASRRFTPDLVRIAQSFPENWTLVIHDGGASSDTVEALKAHDQRGRVAVSTALVPPTDLPALVSSADIGLVFYASDTQNEYLTGRSSEKVALYARAGVPMIAFNYPSFTEVFDEYHCGLGIETLNGITEAAAGIFADYASYQQGAWRAYEQVYEFSRHFQAIADWLKG